jgi:ferredoxin
MAMVVTEPCFGCKYTDCVVVCPVECFYEGESMLFIHPDECIDCGACVGECPVQAIFHEDDVPAAWQGYVELNREMAPRCPQIRTKKSPLKPVGPS